MSEDSQYLRDLTYGIGEREEPLEQAGPDEWPPLPEFDPDRDFVQQDLGYGSSLALTVPMAAVLCVATLVALILVLADA